MTTIQPKHPKIILFLLGAATALMPLSIDMYLPAFPHIAEDLGATISAVEFSLTSFFIGIALGQLFYGPLSDRFGRKPPLYFGLCLAILTSLACSLTPSIHLLIIMRFFQALGICSGAVISRAIIRDMFDHNEAAHYFSLLMAIMGIAPILAPTAGGYLAHYFTWRAIFWTTTAASTLCLAATMRFLPETHGPNPSVQLNRAAHTYWAIVQDRSFMRYVLSGGFAMAGLFAYVTGSSDVLIEHYGIRAEYYGIIFGSNAFGLIGCSQINRWLLKHYHFESILNISALYIFVVGMFLIACAILHAGLIALLVVLFAYVASIGMTSPNMMAGAMAEQGGRIGSASALSGSLQFGIAFASSAIVSMNNAHSPTFLCLVMGGCAFLSYAFFKYMPVKAVPVADMG